MRLTILWSVAFDQLACQPAPRNCGSSAVVMKASICAVVMLAACGSFWAKPKCVWKAASKAVLAGEPAPKPSNGFTSVLMPAKMYSPLKDVLRIEVSVSSATRPLSLVTEAAASPEALAVSTPQKLLRGAGRCW